jgi:hypothetical protein
MASDYLSGHTEVAGAALLPYPPRSMPELAAPPTLGGMWRQRQRIWSNAIGGRRMGVNPRVDSDRSRDGMGCVAPYSCGGSNVVGCFVIPGLSPGARICRPYGL